jgi:L-Ala-D/L-Glu epimerase
MTTAGPGLIRTRAELLDLHLRHTFTIARSSEDVATTVLFHVAHDGIDGLGESAPISRYGESPAGVLDELAGLALDGSDLRALDRTLALAPSRGAMCALDIALHDLAAKRLGVPLYELLGLDPRDAKQTSFTIGIADLATMLAKTREAQHFPTLKIKVGAGGEVETFDALRSIYRGSIRVDANEGWAPERAVEVLRDLARFGIEFCEQPVSAGDPAALRYVRERSPIPIFADESCQTSADVAALAGCVDGIVIKLVKSGGIREAIAMVHVARALGMRVMIGCMIESSVLATAGAHLTPLVDYADLDGPLLVTDDPFEGVRYDGAQLRLPTRPGLGVIAKNAA